MLGSLIDILKLRHKKRCFYVSIEALNSLAIFFSIQLPHFVYFYEIEHSILKFAHYIFVSFIYSISLQIYQPIFSISEFSDICTTINLQEIYRILI